jgi:hypothetical protein
MTRLKALFLVACALVLAGCASSGPNVRSDFAPGVDFSQFKTWGFITPSTAQQRGVSQLTVQHVQASVRTQMERRGLVYTSENPDLLVNFDVATRTKTQSAPRANVGVSYGRGSWGGSSMGIGVQTGTSGQRQVREGTLMIDVVDRAQNQAVWSGSVQGQISNNQPTATVVDNAVSQVFTRFPIAPR